MPTTEERMTILRMIEQNTISAEEGARLLAALDDGSEQGDDAGEAAPPPPIAGNTSSGRSLQIRVTDLNTNRQKVNVNIPAGLARMVMRFIPNNSDFDFQRIQDALEAGVNERIVEVVDSDHNTRVEILVV